MRRLSSLVGAAAALLRSTYTWLAGGLIITVAGAWLVVTRPEEAPHIGGVVLAPLLYFSQWVIYAAIIVLLGLRINQYGRTRTPRQDLGFVLLVVCLYTAGFLLYYTPFVQEYPEGPVAAVVRAGVMFVCGGLGAMYGLSSKHRWR